MQPKATKVVPRDSLESLNNDDDNAEGNSKYWYWYYWYFTSKILSRSAQHTKGSKKVLMTSEIYDGAI